ncbi:MAG TPA: sulfatase-like hydrolase/transferase [Candidatus Paceibacterota bacterium]|nr:sulfatase-like hydrolase/transferase [Verrucomicrobiota bacterium]HSA11864.1 sulfatase-like hydrolase/transferase [Candidatus Paceibacterota bacterium]
MNTSSLLRIVVRWLATRTVMTALLSGQLILAVLPIRAAASPTQNAGDRPNILWLVNEDSGPFLGCYGDPLARTPTLDRLASKGVLFERCFAQPVCAPSRFTLITGMYAATCGPAEHMRAKGKIPGWLRGFPAHLRKAGYYTSNNAKTDYNAPIDMKEAWDASSRNAHWRNRSNPKQPFFSVFNHEVTHESCLFPVEEQTLDFPPTDPAKVRIPPYQPDTPEIRADWARHYNHIALMDAQVGAKLRDLEQSGLADNTIVFYYADNGGVVPRSKRFLQRSGTHVPLIVYFPPKWRHLAPAAPGSRIKEPVSFVDFAPTVLSLAGVKIPDYMMGRAFAGAAKSPPNEYVFCTRDRMDERYDMMRSLMSHRYLYIHNYRPELPYVQRLSYQFQARGYQSWAREAATGHLTPATAQFWGEKPTEELYDLVADPDNVHNLVNDPAYREALEKMRAEMKRRVLAIKDNGFIPEGSPLEGYEASRQPGAVPFERVVDLANLASERKADNLPRLTEALDDPNEAIRWWGALGCAMLRKQAAPAEAALRKRLVDPSGAVQSAAANALAQLGHVETALPVLERWITCTNETFYVLHAANVLIRLGEAGRPLLPLMKKLYAATENAARNSPSAYLRRNLEQNIALLEGREPALVYPKFGPVR